LSGFTLFIPPQTQLCCVQKKSKKPHSGAVKKGQKKEGGFATPFILFFSFYVFSVSRSIGTGYFIRFYGFNSAQIKKFSTITKTTPNPYCAGLLASFPFFFKTPTR